MSVTPAFSAYILEQLNRLAPTTARAMFGGVGLYAAGRIFGLIDNDTLYFKTDEGNRGAFTAAGLPPFQPFGAGTKPMGYYEVSADAIEDPEALRPWLEGALAASRAGVHAGKPKGRRAAAPSAGPERGALRVSATVTIAVPLARLFDTWNSATARRLWLHVPGVTTRRVNGKKTIRLNWNDGSGVLAEFSTLAGGRCVVTVSHEGIRRPAQAVELEAVWEASLRRLKNRLERQR